MADTEKKFTLRLPEDMHAALNQMADEQDRSLHNMIIVILREAINQWKQSKEQRA